MSRRKKTISIGTFDLLKGLGMTGIVAGHICRKYSVDFLPFQIYLMMFGPGLIPMFFLLSGLGGKKREIKDAWKKNAKELLFPYFLTTAVVAAVFPLCHYMAFRWWPGAMTETLRTVSAFLTGCPRGGNTVFGFRIYECTPLWYLLALFWAANLTNIFLKIPSAGWRNAVICLCVLSGYLGSSVNFWYGCIPQGLMAVGFYYAGYLIKKNKLLEKNWSSWIYVVLGIVSAVELIFGEMQYSYGIFKLGLLDYVGCGCIGILLLRLGIWLNRFNGTISEWIRRLGRYTYWAICVHGVEQNCIPWYLLSDSMSSYPNVGFLTELFLRGILIVSGCLIIRRWSVFAHRKKWNQYRR